MKKISFGAVIILVLGCSLFFILRDNGNDKQPTQEVQVTIIIFIVIASFGNKIIPITTKSVF